MQEEGFDPSRNLLVDARDLDIFCTYMTYVQLALYDIPAKVVNGNTLLNEENIVLYTPAYYVFQKLLEQGKLNIPFCNHCLNEINGDVYTSAVNKRYKICKDCYDIEQGLLILRNLMSGEEVKNQ